MAYFHASFAYGYVSVVPKSDHDIVFSN